MNDDFNTPILISHLFECVKIINSIKNGKGSLSSQDLKKMQKIFDSFITNILGFCTEEEEQKNNLTDNLMSLILKLRVVAKEKKDWSSADIIRNDLDKIGINIKDEPKGTTWTLKE